MGLRQSGNALENHDDLVSVRFFFFRDEKELDQVHGRV